MNDDFMNEKKPDYYYNQSSVIPFRYKKGRIEILLITSRKNKKWIFPKGIIEPGYSAIETAEKEAKEEAGVEGEVIPEKIIVYKKKKWNGICKIQVYPMLVEKELKDYPEMNERERIWVDADFADDVIDKKDLRNAFELFLDFLIKFERANK